MPSIRTGLWKLKRSLNNLAFRMSFVKLAPGSSRPLLPIASFIILGFTIFVLAGGLFMLSYGGAAPGLVQRPRGLTFVYPGDIHNQTPQEGVLAMLLYSLGLAGLYMMFMSTRYAYRPNRAYTLLALGIVLTGVFIITAYFVLYDKIGLG